MQLKCQMELIKREKLYTFVKKKKRHIHQSFVCLREVKKLKIIYKSTQIFEHLRRGV